MVASMFFYILAASLWQLCTAADSFIYPGPEKSGSSSDYSKNMVFCLDQKIDIKWSYTSKPPETSLTMRLLPAGGALPSNYVPFDLYKGSNSGSHSWYVDTGDDYSKYAFQLNMYNTGETQPVFRSEAFNITSNCVAASASSSGSSSLPSPSGSSSTVPVGAVTTPAPGSGSGANSSTPTGISTSVSVTAGAVSAATTSNAGPTGANDGGRSATAPLQALVVAVLGNLLYVAL